MPRVTSQVRKLFALAAIAIALPLLAPGTVAAEDADMLPLESAQGWFWQSRPEYSPPAEPLEPLGDPFIRSAQLFAAKHLYVGWDAQDIDDKREMISGVGFDLFGADIPFDATITRFVVTILERPQAERTAGNGSSLSPTSPDLWLARSQGIVACPWGSFFAGDDARPWTTAPTSPGDRRGGDCDRASTSGIPSNEPANPGVLATQTVYPWTFDLTDMMADLWSNSENTAFSLEANTKAPDAQQAASWTTAFHTSMIRNECAPDSACTQQPGVVASVSWVPAPDMVFDPAPDFGAGTEVTTVILPGGGVGSFTQAPPPVAERTQPQPPRLAAGVAEGPRAPFWDIPLYAQAGALALLVILVLAGRTLIAEAPEHGRPPGATSLLMQGKERGA